MRKIITQLLIFILGTLSIIFSQDDGVLLSIDNVDLMVPHQANQRIIEAVTKKLGIPANKVFMNIDKYGNTSAASIPIGIHEAREAGLILPGSLSLLAVVGAGLTWGAVLIRW